MATLTVGDTGADLDTGWTGISHNQGVTVGSSVQICLEGCDMDTNPVCTGIGTTGGGNKLNGQYFGSPLPLIAADVPTCVLNEFRDDIRVDNFNLETGEIDMTILLTSRVHQGVSTSFPCPVCNAPERIGASGTCRFGPDEGKRCTVGGLTNFGPTSADCKPNPVDNIGNLRIDLPLTTSTKTQDGRAFQCLPQSAGGSGGRCPCENQLKQNDCASACNEGMCPSGLSPGVDQVCCRDEANGRRGCFAANEDVTRSGVPAIPYADANAQTGAWPDPTYPKTALGGALATPFCIPATTDNVVNSVAGLAGPGALILPGPVLIENTVP